MKQRTYRCNRCGREVRGQGAVAHLRAAHGATGMLKDNLDMVTVVREEEIPNPRQSLVVSRRPRLAERVRSKVAVVDNGSLVLHSTAIKLMQSSDGELFVVTPLADLLKRGE